MGSFLSSLVTPPPAADDPNCAVVAAHSKATYDEQWAAAKSSGKLMVIDFSASWCGPCRFIEPAFKEMASKYTDVAFVKIDVDELAVRLMIRFSFLLSARFVRGLGGQIRRLRL
uniref:Thioredoxin domain-containing protein n=1 Tax=Setaria italica TaxID=4555 RepID=K4AGV7_SETIT